jgi:hypothetical protein
MELNIMENGTTMVISMVEVFNYGLMAQNIVVIGLIIKLIKRVN